MATTPAEGPEVAEFGRGPAALFASCPPWIRELDLMRTACSHFLVTGNSGDSQLVPGALIGEEGVTAFAAMEDVLTAALSTMGHEVVVHHDIVTGVRYSWDPVQNDQLSQQAAALLGRPLEQVARPGDLDGLADLVALVAESEHPLGLVLHEAARLTQDIAQLSEAEFAFFRRVNHLTRSMSLAGERTTFNPVVWLVGSERDLPSWLVIENHQVRHVAVPVPDPQMRRQAAELWVRWLPEGVGGDRAVDPVEVFAAQTAGFTLDQANACIRLAQEQGLDQTEVEDAVRSYRVGVLDNPWRRTYVADRLRREFSDDPTLTKRVIGQNRAVQRALDILVRSATGLTAAHASRSATRPRGVLFFAGPTGVGKTELAKALTELLFDDAEAYIRFDMSEFSSEHAADRLIGAPPGYVGHDAGGELTNKIRERPFSVVLFDEIEKADARILDKFLQILDDGRLTDGQGQTVHFTESVIIFTSNLGVYVKGTAPGGKRELNVTRELTSEELQLKLTEAIRDHFTRELGRPELLNRLGDNIVVFDFIDEDAGALILDGMIDNVLGRVETEQGIRLSLADDVSAWLRERCLKTDTLDLGGRGIGSALESHLVNPLARAVFLHKDELGSAARVSSVSYEDGLVVLNLQAEAT